jgi:hypothetical protein
MRVNDQGLLASFPLVDPELEGDLTWASIVSFAPIMLSPLQLVPAPSSSNPPSGNFLL